MIGEAEGYGESLSDYTEATAQALEAALKAAKLADANEEATQEEVEAAAEALSEALAGLQLDVSDLEALIEKAEEMDLSNYTAESAACLLYTSRCV